MSEESMKEYLERQDILMKRWRDVAAIGCLSEITPGVFCTDLDEKKECETCQARRELKEYEELKDQYFYITEKGKRELG